MQVLLGVIATSSCAARLRISSEIPGKQYKILGLYSEILGKWYRIPGLHSIIPGKRYKAPGNHSEIPGKYRTNLW
jgi:hypothetical protein